MSDNKSEKVNGGRRPGAGRKPGVPNKVPNSVKEMVLATLDDLGGRKYLKTVATEFPQSFCTLLSKCMPTVVSGDAENPLQHLHSFSDVPKETIEARLNALKSQS